MVAVIHRHDGSTSTQLPNELPSIVSCLPTVEGIPHQRLRQFRFFFWNKFHVLHVQTKDTQRIGRNSISKTTARNLQCLLTGHHFVRVLQAVLVRTVPTCQHHHRTAGRGSMCQINRSLLRCGRRIDQLHVQHACLVVDIGRDVYLAAHRQSEIMQERTVQIALHVRAVHFDFNTVGMSCFQRPTHGSHRSLRPVGANFHPVLGVAPSAEVPPTIIVSVPAIKGDEETLRPTGLRGFHLIRIVLSRLHIADIKFALHALIRLFQHAARSGPRASVGLPFWFYGREIVTEDYRPVACRDFHVVESGTRAPRAQADAPGAQQLVVFLRPLHILFSYIVREKLLHVVRRRTVTGITVETDHVRTPVVIVFVDEYRGIAVHDANIGVVFHPLHEDRLSQRRIQMTIDAIVLCHSILSHIDLVACPAIRIILVILVDKP